MEKDRYDEGVPSWVDLTTSDPPAAAAFYSELFGWEAPEGPPEFEGYRTCTLRGRTVAGINGVAADGPSYWASYVNVGSADGTVATVAAAGGKVLFGPQDVGDLGRLAAFADPAGAVLGLWQPRAHIGAQLVNEPGTFCWNELMVTDTDSARAFYPQVFGWGTSPSPADGPLQYLEWTVEGTSVAGMLPTPPSVPAGTPPAWTVYFAVPDADVAVARIEELGGSSVAPPLDMPVGRIAVVRDPQGAFFNVIALASA